MSLPRIIGVAVSAAERFIERTDQVSVFDEDFNQLFRAARTLKATVKIMSQVMKHPLETGASVIDHRVLQPIEIELSMVVDAYRFPEVYDQIKQNYINGTSLIVHTHAAVYENQFITDMPHEETPDLLGSLQIALKLEQKLIAGSTVTTKLPKHAINSNTADKGNQQPQTPTPKKQESAARYLLNYYHVEPIV